MAKKDKGIRHNGSSAAAERSANEGADLSYIWLEAQAMADEMVELRRDFHMHPELSQQETRTAQVIADYLRKLGGIEVQEGIAGTGVVGLIRGVAGGGKTIMLRADIDGLPIIEANDAPYRSVNPGVMHACGHDTHITVALATARLVSKHRDQLRGNLKLCFQPAEERAGGAAPMIKQGVMQNPTVDRVIGFHVSSDLPVGLVAIRAGASAAGVEEFVITVKGRGGHGAHPDQTVDPIVTAAHIVTALQSIVARNLDPVDKAVVSVGKVEAGTAFNIIPDECKLSGTLRFFSEDVHKLLLKRVKEVAKGVAKAMGADADVQITPEITMIPVVNNPEVSEWMKTVAARTIGAECVFTPPQIMGADDMALFLKEAPGCYLGIGGRNSKKGFEGPHHSATFDIDEDCLPVALAMMAGGVLDYLHDLSDFQQSQPKARRTKWQRKARTRVFTTTEAATAATRR